MGFFFTKPIQAVLMPKLNQTTTIDDMTKVT